MKRRKFSIYNEILHSTRRVARKIKHNMKKVPKKRALGIAIAFSIVAILMIGTLLISFLAPYLNLDMPTTVEDTRTDDQIARSCTDDSDCVADSCCHSFRCVNERYAPSCFGIACTMDCQPETMDCGQGYCACTSGLCEAYIQNP